jgi:hypothetical protein
VLRLLVAYPIRSGLTRGFATANGEYLNLARPSYVSTHNRTDVSRELALDIVLHPSSYYVNVHNEEFPRPRGALRGQLNR